MNASEFRDTLYGSRHMYMDHESQENDNHGIRNLLMIYCNYSYACGYMKSKRPNPHDFEARTRPVGPRPLDGLQREPLTNGEDTWWICVLRIFLFEYNMKETS